MPNKSIIPLQCRIATMALLLIGFGKASYAEMSPDNPLTLSQALATALLKNPSLQAYAFEPRISEARILQSRIRPNPELSVGVENALGTGELSGIKRLETTLQLSRIIELGGSRDRRIESAQSEKALVDADYEIRRLDVLSEVARRFTETAADGERLSAARRSREGAERTVEAVRKRVEAAVVSPIELNKAQTALALLRIEEEHAEHELASSRQFLAAILGETKPQFGPIKADLLELPAIDEFEALAERLENAPALARFGLEEHWREAQERLALSLRRSKMQVSGGLRRIESTDDFGFVMGVSIPLTLRDQQQGNIREARERRNQLAASKEAMRLEMRATLFAVYQEMMHARTAFELLQQEIIPTAEETLRLTDDGYRAGRFSLLQLLDAQKSLIEMQSQSVANAAAFHLYVVEIERLLGASVEGDYNRS